MGVTIGGKPLGSPSNDFSQHLKSTPVKGHTSVQVKGLPEKSQEETLHKGLVIPLDKLHHLHVSGSSTVNLGNYNSAKITVGITMPCTLETLAESYDFATSWVEGKIGEATQAVKETGDGG